MPVILKYESAAGDSSYDQERLGAANYRLR